MDTHLLSASRAELLEIIERQERVIAALQAEVASLRAQQGQPEAKEAEGGGEGDGGMPAFVKANGRQGLREGPRKKRSKGYARRRGVATQRVEHALDHCAACGCSIRGGSVKRIRQVLHLALQPVQVIEHAFIERRCPCCGKRNVPRSAEVLQGVVVGRHRLSNTTMALIAALREVGRLPLRTICWYLRTFHALQLSVGEVTAVLAAVAKQGQGMVQWIIQELRSSPVVHGDETTWREDGQNGYFWVFSTPLMRYFLHRASRSGDVLEDVLGADFEGALVSDFYAAYNRLLGRHQRCWAHLLRAVHELGEKWPDTPALQQWAEEVHALYRRAQDYCANHPQAKPQERLAAQHRYEQELMALAEPHLQQDCPQQVLCQRIARYLPELFTFVADPRVPADNNAAERAIRPFAISRKISGGTRSPVGSEVKGILATLFGTWLAQSLNPFPACVQLLNPP
jgi:transposase